VRPFALSLRRDAPPTAPSSHRRLTRNAASSVGRRVGRHARRRASSLRLQGASRTRARRPLACALGSASMLSAPTTAVAALARRLAAPRPALDYALRPTGLCRKLSPSFGTCAVCRSRRRHAGSARACVRACRTDARGQPRACVSKLCAHMLRHEAGGGSCVMRRPRQRGTCDTPHLDLR
jgi:hypothetical protein